jgi:hypothetical protein
MAIHVKKRTMLIFLGITGVLLLIFNSYQNFIEKSSISIYFEAKFGSCKDSYVELRWG